MNDVREEMRRELDARREVGWRSAMVVMRELTNELRFRGASATLVALVQNNEGYRGLLAMANNQRCQIEMESCSRERKMIEVNLQATFLECRNRVRNAKPFALSASRSLHHALTSTSPPFVVISPLSIKSVHIHVVFSY